MAMAVFEGFRRLNVPSEFLYFRNNTDPITGEEGLLATYEKVLGTVLFSVAIVPFSETGVDKKTAMQIISDIGVAWNDPQNKQKCLELWLEQTATNFDFTGFCIMAHKKGVVDLNAMFSKGVQ